MISVDVFICTYKRLGSLKRCLESFDELLGKPGFTLYVVDNDPQGSAKSLVGLAHPAIKYVNERRKGLSYARNYAIDHGEGDYISFIDDDECVSLKWLLSALDFLDKHECDIMFGGVKSVYPKGAEDWVVTVDAFSSAERKHASIVDCGGAGNVFIKRVSILNSGIRFDHAFSSTGGEDSMLFRRLSKQGLVLMWNNEIWVDEYIEKNRLNKKYLLIRAYRDGQCYARSYLAIAGRMQKLIWLSKRLIKFPIDLISVLLVLCSTSKALKVKVLRRFLKNVGQLSVLTGKYVEMYA